MPKTGIKKGDIVWLEGWSGILGKVVSFSGKKLELTFPKSLRWRYDDIQPWTTFYPVYKDQLTVLSANEVFEKMAKIFEQHLKALALTVERSTRDSFFRFEI